MQIFCLADQLSNLKNVVYYSYIAINDEKKFEVNYNKTC